MQGPGKKKLGFSNFFRRWIQNVQASTLRGGPVDVLWELSQGKKGKT